MRRSSEPTLNMNIIYGPRFGLIKRYAACRCDTLYIKWIRRENSNHLIYSSFQCLYAFEWTYGELRLSLLLQAVAKKLAELSGKGVTTIIGGGDSVAAVEKVGVAEVMSHISTGGGASLELLEGKQLPGVLALDEATPVPV